MSLPTPFAYRITLKKDWDEAQVSGFVARSPLDQRDGFYHFSTASQVPGTLGRYFRGVSDLVLLQMNLDKMGWDINFDVAPNVVGNNFFPHLYREKLMLSEVTSAFTITWNEQQQVHEIDNPLTFRPEPVEPIRHVLLHITHSALISLAVLRHRMSQAADLVLRDHSDGDGGIDVVVDLENSASAQSLSMTSLCTLLHRIYQVGSEVALSRGQPLLNIRVFLPGLGAENIVASSELQVVISDDQAFIESLNQRRMASNASQVEIVAPSPIDISADPSCDSAASADHHNSIRVFQHVVFGGTFDHLHAGHKIMLAIAAASASESVVIGLSVDELLAKKKFAAQLESFEQRAQRLREFIACMKPELKVDIEPLRDIYGPSTARGELQALIVSEETRSGGALVNQRRIELGHSPCEVVVIPLVQSDDPSTKISSTDIRRWVAERQSLLQLAEKSHSRLAHHWRSIVQELNIDDKIAESWYNIIVAQYTQSHRAYHTLQHLDSLFQLFEKFESVVTDKLSMKLAIFFHDLIYDHAHKRKDLEERSAVEFLHFALQIHLPSEQTYKIKDWIMATKKHFQTQTEDLDLKLFLDLDLSILAADWPQYQAYAAGIAFEYCGLGAAAYREGRARVLRSFAAAQRPALFASTLVPQAEREQWEQRARANIAAELAELEGGSNSPTTAAGSASSQHEEKSA